ncbi:MAG: 3-dehydroquinate synthase [Sphingomicrobium sp.]|nr:3-dehydroquinate synthase [Sphingomonadales bacterium]
MTTIRAELGPRSYDIIIEHGLLDRAAELLSPYARDGRLIVVSDDQVWPAQGSRLGGLNVSPVIVPAGEGSKSWATLADLVDRLLALGVERGDHIVALGGGVIGDLVGFAAAIVKRGCSFIQVPTSLLAQVDSSVGGKTAINVPAGKNMVGAFHQPSLVLIDPVVLDTLPDRHMNAGYAEIVKYALIEDAIFFDWLVSNASSVLERDPAALHHAIAIAVGGKARIVADDERETKDCRALLNLGHTFGHALETETGFSDRLLHGEAVAAGVMLAFDFSVERGLCPSQDAERVRAHLREVGLPVTLAAASIRATGERLVEHMLLDKKREGGRLPFILTCGIGRSFVDKDVDLVEVANFLDRHE